MTEVKTLDITNSTTGSSMTARDEEISLEKQEKQIIAKLCYSELKYGRVIGKGGFSNIFEVNKINLNLTNLANDKTSTESLSNEEEIARNKLQSHHNKHYPTKTLVLKKLRPDLSQSEQSKGILDLIIECNFLSELHHSNIITIHGQASEEIPKANFFILLERLHETLDEKIDAWRVEVIQARGIWCCFPLMCLCVRRKRRLHRLWKERFEVLKDVASALRFLHRHDIVYRDLKPDNVGFDQNNIVKLFDFGLAKKIEPRFEVEGDKGVYRLTGNTGSLRYMAPEVARGLPYNQLVDSYSFGILFWQVCALTIPYAGYTCKMHSELIVEQNHRPKLDTSWPISWRNLMQSCWATDFRLRPEFDAIFSELDSQLSTWLMLGAAVSTSGEIRAKQKKKKLKEDDDGALDIDTRLHLDQNRVHENSIV